MKKSLNALPLLFLSLICMYSTSIFSAPPNLGIVKNEVIKYHDSGLYEREITKKINEARQYILKQVQMHHHKKQEKLALVLDIDETSLSNYDKMVNRDFTATSEQLHQENLNGNAPAIKPTLALYQDAIKNGVSVFFVTGREQSEQKATERNLKNTGYINWSHLYFRPKHYHPKSIASFKSKIRGMIERQGFIIIATIGDQYSDIKGGHAEKGFKLPNPYYYIP